MLSLFPPTWRPYFYTNGSVFGEYIVFKVLFFRFELAHGLKCVILTSITNLLLRIIPSIDGM